ncbi:hypothetical protein [Geodermatophilus marinus]|uniref:hypothetical protein n=1 Tax=Geodermatophilus sp. LHW52908 TaxID=2303986 RepID=UPI000E3BCD44|nr:hypothetical protein [Geodermatophilus sp. LHW52908]RFU21075.1 hypothetical protein D0Z06_12805 [Geodermatophilus sp. LHW52908]
MGLLDRLFGGRRREPVRPAPPAARPVHGGAPTGRPVDAAPGDQQAIERYRYLLRTAPPDAIEQAHAEAFAQLTPQQRQEVLTQLAAAVPEAERPRADDPGALARAATRAELRRPGTLERAFGGTGPGGRPGFGSTVGAGLLGTVGGLVIGTAVADALFDTGAGDGGLVGGGDEEAYAGGEEGYADGGGSGGGDFGGGDFGGGDFGGGF